MQHQVTFTTEQLDSLCKTFKVKRSNGYIDLKTELNKALLDDYVDKLNNFVFSTPEYPHFFELSSVFGGSRSMLTTLKMNQMAYHTLESIYAQPVLLNLQKLPRIFAMLIMAIQIIHVFEPNNRYTKIQLVSVIYAAVADTLSKHDIEITTRNGDFSPMLENINRFIKKALKDNVVDIGEIRIQTEADIDRYIKPIKPIYKVYA